MITDTLLEELVRTAPLVLLTLKDEKEIAKANNFLPYSTGFEIECEKDKLYNKDCFSVIPDILDIDVDSSEQRYRIPNGIRGLICLYHICEQLKRNSLLNYGSGIHYHVDCTESNMDKSNALSKNCMWILEELDTWNYKGKYNTRGIGVLELSREYTIVQGAWVRPNSIGTLEFRIGEMSFEYETLAKRIIHCNSIVRRLKDQADIKEPTYTNLNSQLILDYNKTVPQNISGYQIRMMKLNLQLAENYKKLQELDVVEEEKTPFQKIKEFVYSRIHRI